MKNSEQTTWTSNEQNNADYHAEFTSHKGSQPRTQREVESPDSIDDVRLRRTALQQTLWEFLRFPNTGEQPCYQSMEAFPGAGFTCQSPSSAAINHGCRRRWSGRGQVAVNKTNQAALLSQQKLRIFENTGQHMRCIKLAARPVDEWEETSNVPPPELHRRSTFPGSTTGRTSNNDVIQQVSSWLSARVKGCTLILMLANISSESPVLSSVEFLGSSPDFPPPISFGFLFICVYICVSLHACPAYPESGTLPGG